MKEISNLFANELISFKVADSFFSKNAGMEESLNQFGRSLMDINDYQTMMVRIDKRCFSLIFTILSCCRYVNGRSFS